MRFRSEDARFMLRSPAQAAEHPRYAHPPKRLLVWLVVHKRLRWLFAASEATRSVNDWPSRVLSRSLASACCVYHCPKHKFYSVTGKAGCKNELETATLMLLCEMGHKGLMQIADATKRTNSRK